MTEDTFKLADEVRAENHGEGWDPATETAIPQPAETTETTPAAVVPLDVSPEKVDETVVNQ